MARSLGNPIADTILNAIDDSLVGFNELRFKDLERLSRKPKWDSILVSQQELYKNTGVIVAAKRVGKEVLLHFVGPKKKLREIFQELADQFND